MRFGIFSDIHANLEALEAVVEAYKNESIDAYFCLGDFVNYGADPVACLGAISVLNPVSVAGNHDRAAVDMFPESYFNRDAAEALRWTKGRMTPVYSEFLKSLDLVYADAALTLVHGTLDHPEDFGYLFDENSVRRSLACLRGNVLFAGHTHAAMIYVEEAKGAVGFSAAPRVVMDPRNRYIVNVGSVGQPRDNNPLAAYCLYDSDSGMVEIRRVRYDVETARKKIISAGLPRVLGDRLRSGR